MGKKLVKDRRQSDGSDLFGAHFSIAGGLENALVDAARYDCVVCQIFTKNASTWKERVLTAEEAATFEQSRKAHGIQAVASHTAYLINPASSEKETAEKSRNALVCEMNRSHLLGLTDVVLHPGAHKDAGEAAGIRSAAKMIRSVLDDTAGASPRLLLETTAGQGTSLGHRFEQLADIMDAVGMPERMGVCLDTSHIFAAGYDIRTPTAYEETMSRFDTIIGLENLRLIHVNDSKKDLGTRVDRHAHIGKGLIGRNAFGLIVNDPRLKYIPKILETPKKEGDKDWDAINLKVLRRLVIK